MSDLNVYNPTTVREAMDVKLKEVDTLRAQVKELEDFIQGLANDHYARLSVLEWLRERKHDARTS